MTLSNSFNRSANSWTISIDPSIVLLFIARVGNEKILAISSLYLISGKGEGHFRYIEIL